MSCGDSCDPVKIIFHDTPDVEELPTSFKEETHQIKFLASEFFTASPQAPSNLSVVETRAEEVDLDWDSVDTDDYTIYVKNVSTGITEQTITGIIGTSTTVFGLTEETEYEFWVTAVRDGIESEESNHVTTITPSGEEVRNTNSLSFDGVDDIVTVGDVHDINNSSQTWMCFFKTTQSSTLRLMDKRGQGASGGGFPGMQLSITGGTFDNVILEDADQNTISFLGDGISAPINNVWHHIALVWDNSTGTLKIFLDFAEVGSKTNSDMIGSDCSTSRDFCFGAANTLGQFYEGLLDEVQVWDKALSLAEIKDYGSKILNGSEADLLGYWNSEDREGSHLTDITSNNNHGTITGATYEYDGFDFDYSLKFDGVDDHVEFNTVPVTGTQARSISALIKTTNSTKNQAIASFGTDTTGGRFTFRLNSGVLRIEVAGAGQNGSINVADGEWHHVEVTYNGNGNINGCKVYVDGVLDYSVSTSLSINTGNTYFRIGDDPNFSYHFDGHIDKVAIWDKERTQSEIQRSINNEFTGEEDNLVRLYKFDDLSDLSVAVDSTENENGSINGAEYSTDVVSYFQGISFDGVDDYVNVGTLGNFGSTHFENPFSIECRFITRSTDIASIIGMTDASEGSSDNLGEIFNFNLNQAEDGSNASGHVRAIIRSDRISGGAMVASTEVGVDHGFNNGKVHNLYIGIDYDNAVELRIDGELVDFTITNFAGGTPNFIDFNNTVYFGAGHQRTGGIFNPLNGIIEELRIWTDWRTENEVKDNLSVVLEGNEDNLFSLWRTREGVGSITYDHASNNHGTINGAAFTPKVGVKI